MNCPAFVAVMAIVLLPFAQRTAAQPFSQVIVFGDSNVDSGWYRQLPSGSTPGSGANFNADWPAALAAGAGVPTTPVPPTAGMPNPSSMNVQYLAAMLGLTANPANTAGGTNYATSGAKNEIANSAANGGFAAAIPTGTQIRSYLSAHGNVADSKALYVIWSGDNDVSYANGDTGTSPPPDPDAANAYLLQAAQDLGGDILALKNAGAQNIVVAGLAYYFPTGSSDDATNRRALKLYYTQQLFQNLKQIGIPYIAADTNALRVAIFNNPSLYGFTNVGTGAGQFACSQPAGVTTAWALLCSSNQAAPSTYSGSTAQTDLFADDQHLATAGQKLFGLFLYNLVTQKPPLLAAVLPASRSAQLNATVTAFATIINTGPTTATGCSIAPAQNLPTNFVYQTTNPATNALTGTPNTPVNIPGNNGSQSFVIAFMPTELIPPTDVNFVFSCTNVLLPAPVVTGLNTLLLSAATSLPPDIVALVATLQNDGIVHVIGAPQAGAFAVATTNLGSPGTITVATNTGAATLPITITVCQTNPQSGQCLQTPAAMVSTTINTNTTPTFAIFVTTGTVGVTVPFDPTNNRIFVTFTDSGGAVRGKTSVAVATQ